MSLFSYQATYTAPPGAGPQQPPAPSCGTSGWGNTTYVQPPASTPAPAPAPGGSSTGEDLPMSLSVDIACPTFTGAITAKGAAVVLAVPAGAKRYRVWFSTATETTPGASVGAVPFNSDIPAEGPVNGHQLIVAPLWGLLGAGAPSVTARPSRQCS